MKINTKITITNPIASLTHSGEKFDQGELLQDTESNANGEVDALGQKLNGKTRRLIDARDKDRAEKETAKHVQIEGTFPGLLEAIPDAVVVTHAHGQIIAVNAQMEKLFGYPRTVLLGQPIEMLMPERFRRAHCDQRANYAAAPHVRPVGNGLSLCAQRQDGSEFFVEVSLSPLETDAGTLVLSVIRDVTARQQMELSLREARDELEQRVAERLADLHLTNARLQDEIVMRKRVENDLEAKTRELAARNLELERSNQELDDFAYIASHDLKEPLRGLHNYSMFLLEDYGGLLDDQGRAKLETLVRLTKRMEDLINSLLYYSRVGRVDLASRETDLSTVVTEVIESLAIPLQDAGVEIRIPMPLPTICCDTVRVGEVFRNLITNAMKYNDKPQKWIEIGVANGQGQADGPCPSGTLACDAHRLPVFYVRDNGIGIQKRHQEVIFRIFKRLHGRDQYGGGTGSGLTIVKKIVERHGGGIWIESSPGHGTTVFFTLQSLTPRTAHKKQPTVDSYDQVA